MMKKYSAIAVAVFCLLGLAGVVQAQTDESHWGMSMNFAPNWQVYQPVLKKLVNADQIDIRGREMSLGLVHGRAQGGDWGVSLTRVNIASSQLVTAAGYLVVGNVGSFVNVDTYALNAVSVTGVEVHKFVPFATIKRRVQVGMNFGGGVVHLSGEATKTALRYEVRGLTVIPTTTVTHEEAAKGLGGRDILPTGRAEVAVTTILGQGVKLRFAGGIGFPGYSRFNVGVMYLFGSP